MKEINRINSPYPAIFIDDFLPSSALLRAASESFSDVASDDWAKYSSETGQIQFASKDRSLIPTAALTVLDYVSTHFDPNDVFGGLTTDAFPDLSYYAAGMALTPNSNGEGGFLAMHRDADIHGKNLRWKREYSAVLCVSEEYDESFDLRIHDGEQSHARIPYKFNRLVSFRTEENSWHGFPNTITEGLDRKVLSVFYWSKLADIAPKEKIPGIRYRSEFRYDLEFK